MDSAKDRINALRSEGSNEQSALQKFASWARSNREENESDDSVFERFLESFMGSPAERGARKKAAGHYNEGGIADDGLNVDPVSGNEIPPGSLATEVRDDIPAQLSEGEYVVPADVVRYYGVRYFEDLRNEAKGGLNEMEANGRIGGEPVLAPDEDTEALSPEEMQELEAVMGMYAGGDVRQGYYPGGFVAPTSTFNAANYRPGYTFAENSTPAPVTPSSSSVTLYGPAGEIATLSLPAEQARYDELLGQGYKTSQAAVTTPTTGVGEGVGSQESGGSNNDDDDGMFKDPGERESRAPSIDFDVDDPLAAVDAALDSKNWFGKVGGALAGTAIGGPLVGRGLSVSGESIQGFYNLKEAAANLAIAKEQGLDVTKQQAAFDEKVKALGLGAQLLRAEGALEDAAKAAVNMYREMINAPKVESPTLTALQETGLAAKQAAQEKLSKLSGSAARYAEDQIKRGYTGSSVGGIAVGNISGVDGPAGVVANSDGTVVKTEDRKTVFRDDEGKTYVKTGFFGTGREYRTIPGVSDQVTQSDRTTGSDKPTTTKAPTGGSGSGSSNNNNSGSSGGGLYKSITGTSFKDTATGQALGLSNSSSNDSSGGSTGGGGWKDSGWNPSNWF